MIGVHERFEVSAPPEQVWTVMRDPAAVVECVPGASLGPPDKDGNLHATLLVKFGPLRVSFDAHVSLELDDAAMTGVVKATAKDARGGARVQAAMDYVVVAAPGGSAVSIAGGIEVTGPVAAVIEGGSQVVIKRMSSEFAQALAAKCAASNRS